MSEMGGGRRARPSSPELNRLRAEIDELDRRIVGLLNERAELTRAVWHEKVAIGRRAIRDREREREVLLRVSIANEGPISQVDLLAIYRRLGDRFGEFSARVDIANARLVRGQLAAVVDDIEPCLAFFKSVGAQDSVSECLYLRGEACRRLGRLDEARVEFARAASLTRNARERNLLLERAAACRMPTS